MNIETGKVISDADFQALPEEKKSGYVSVSGQQAEEMRGMNRAQRRKYMKTNGLLKKEKK